MKPLTIKLCVPMGFKVHFPILDFQLIKKYSCDTIPKPINC